MDIQSIAAIVFIVFLTIYLFVIRKKLEMQKILFPLLYIILKRSRLGLVFMKKIANKFPKAVKILASIGVVIGFIGMIFISIQLVVLFANMLSEPSAPSGVAPVLPIPVKGAVYVPFFYWIISIFVIATVHEFAHGIVSNAYKVPVRSSGFAFFGLVLPIIPAAFVEPDERILQKKSAWKQLSVFAAGPFSNIVLAFIVLGLMLVAVNPLSNAAFMNTGVTVTGIINGTAAADTGLAADDIITFVDGEEIRTVEEFTSILSEKEAGEAISIITEDDSFDVILGGRDDDSEKGFLGVTVSPAVAENPEFVEKYGNWAVTGITWISELFFWLYLLNLGIGLFNLVPLGIVDGGRMLQITLASLFKSKTGLQRAQNAWKIISMIFLFIVLFMLISSFL
jgi:membrane-associated protease RseP (regulator of RpoE activity)